MPFPNGPDHALTPEQVADGLAPTLDDRARQLDPDYPAWFAALLERCGPGTVPVFQGEGLLRGAEPACVGPDGAVEALELGPEPPEPTRDRGQFDLGP